LYARIHSLTAHLSDPSGCTECAARVVAFNNAIPAWAANKTTSASPITVIDLWTGFNTTTDTYDGVHPVRFLNKISNMDSLLTLPQNDTGNKKIAPKWHSYLYPLV